MTKYFIVSRPGHSVEVSRHDLEEFEKWLARDLAYRRKRSKKHRLSSPDQGDANVGAIKSRTRLHQLVRRVLLGKQRESDQPESNHSVTGYGHRIEPLPRRRQ
jgi:hypothetical protein